MFQSIDETEIFKMYHVRNWQNSKLRKYLKLSKLDSFPSICSLAAGIEAENPLKVLCMAFAADLQRIARTPI